MFKLPAFLGGFTSNLLKIVIQNTFETYSIVKQIKPTVNCIAKKSSTAQSLKKTKNKQKKTLAS